MPDAELIVNDSEYLARPEEERITQAEKNKHMQAQLKVDHYIAFFYLDVLGDYLNTFNPTSINRS